MAPKLYSYSESGNAYKCRLLASLLTIELEVHEIDYVGDEQHSPAYLAINPRGEVPALVDGDVTLVDSSAILIHLAGTYGGDGPSSFWSLKPIEQASIVQWLAFSSSWIQFGLFSTRALVSGRGAWNGLGTTKTPGSLEDATTRALKSLDILETRLRAHDWLALGRPTVADIAVFPYVALAHLGNVDLQPFPAVARWIERIKRLEGWFPAAGMK